MHQVLHGTTIAKTIVAGVAITIPLTVIAVISGAVVIQAIALFILIETWNPEEAVDAHCKRKKERRGLKSSLCAPRSY